MNTDLSVCAPSGQGWAEINWFQVQLQVKKLQARIVKATQAGKQGKVKALQWLLTHSFSCKALAVKRVTENRGKNTPGVDKVIWNTSKAKTNAIASLLRRGYKPLPLRRVLIPKKKGKTRPLTGTPTGSGQNARQQMQGNNVSPALPRATTPHGCLRPTLKPVSILSVMNG